MTLVQDIINQTNRIERNMATVQDINQDIADLMPEPVLITAPPLRIHPLMEVARYKRGVELRLPVVRLHENRWIVVEHEGEERSLRYQAYGIVIKTIARHAMETELGIDGLVGKTLVFSMSPAMRAEVSVQ